MPELVSARAYSDVECNFKSITRNVLSVASSLSSAKDVRDFFVLAVEKIVEPLKAMGLEKQEVKLGRQLQVFITCSINLFSPFRWRCC